jgi:hypothetical protein
MDDLRANPFAIKEGQAGKAQQGSKSVARPTKKKSKVNDVM